MPQSSAHRSLRSARLRMAILLAAGLSITVLAQEGSSQKQQPADPYADDATPTSAEDVVKRLMGQKRDNPVIEPTQRHGKKRRAASSPYDVDPRILGTAPGAQQPTLRREGEFIITRRGRVVRAPDGVNTLFVFESDSKDATDPPMVLMPCARRQDMEDYITERGDKVVFVLSGQVFVYRGLNYLLPTMFKLDINKGNLQ